MDSTGALDVSKVPEKMAVIGGGVIGLEMGSVWSRLGSEVTVIEFMDRLCPAMDKELTKKFQTTLKKQGFKFQMKTKVMESEVVGEKIKLKTEKSAGGGEKEQEFDLVLVATGRRPYTEVRAWTKHIEERSDEFQVADRPLRYARTILTHQLIVAGPWP